MLRRDFTKVGVLSLLTPSVCQGSTDVCVTPLLPTIYSAVYINNQLEYTCVQKRGRRFTHFSSQKSLNRLKPDFYNKNSGESRWVYWPREYGVECHNVLYDKMELLSQVENFELLVQKAIINEIMRREYLEYRKKRLTLAIDIDITTNINRRFHAKTKWNMSIMRGNDMQILSDVDQLAVAEGRTTVDFVKNTHGRIEQEVGCREFNVAVVKG